MDIRPKFRIGFSMPNNTHESLLTIDENTTFGLDWGYDAEGLYAGDDFIYQGLVGGDATPYVIQGIPEITNNLEIPLICGASEDNTRATITLNSMENPIEGVKVYLKDYSNGDITDLTEESHSIILDAGVVSDRVVLLFKVALNYKKTKSSIEVDGNIRSINTSTGNVVEIDPEAGGFQYKEDDNEHELALPKKSGTLATLEDVSSGGNLDGGSASSIFTKEQTLDGGDAGYI